MKVNIKKWMSHKEQYANIRRYSWSVARLVELSKDLAVFDMPMLAVDVSHTFSHVNLKEFAMHMQAVKDADLDFPIILDEDGELMDGRHRIIKALLEGRETIKAVRFETNPEPCIIKPEE